MKKDVDVIAVFDFDGTITSKSTTLPFLRFLDERNFLYKVLSQFYVVAGYQLHLIHIDTMNRIISKSFFQGLHRDYLFAMGQLFNQRIIPKLLKPSALQKLQWHKSQGHTCILASSAFNIYIDNWALSNGFDGVVSTQIAFDAQGVATGNLVGKSCNGDEKLRRTLELIGTESRIIHAYGDTSGDVPLLNYATYPHYRCF